ncbi:MAG: hypothetical protein AB7I27_00390 [Bacteriovoracaceae bacterium]
MKFFTLLVFMVMSLVADAAIRPSGRSTNLKYDGSIDTSTLEKEFINVVNKSGSTLAAGAVVILDVTNDDGASVTTTTSASQVPMCVNTKSCAANALCECQTYGYFSAALFHVGGGNAVAGRPFYISTGTAGYIKAIASPAASDIPGGVFYDAASASGAVEVFLKMK